MSGTCHTQNASNAQRPYQEIHAHPQENENACNPRLDWRHATFVDRCIVVVHLFAVVLQDSLSELASHFGV